MASGKSIRAGKAFVEISLRDKLSGQLMKLKAKVQAVGRSFQAVGAGFAAVGAGIVTPLLTATAAFASAGDKLDKLSTRTGVSVESLSTLKFAAEQSGSSIESLGAALFRMNRRIGNATKGTGPAVRALKELGLSAAELSQLTPDEQFKVLADRLGTVENSALAAQYGFEILGDNFKDLVPLMANGAAGIEALQKKAESLNLTMTGSQAKAAAAFADAWGSIKDQMKAATVQIGAALAPMLTNLLGKITPIMTATIGWIKENGSLIQTALKVGAAVGAVGVALLAAGTAIVGIGAVFGGLSAIISGVGTAIGFLISPLGLVIAAVVGLGAVIATQTQLGADAMAWLGDKFGGLMDDATAAFGGIKDALSAGDFKMAATILWTALQIQWQKGINFLNSAWVGFQKMFLQAAADSTKAVMDIFSLSVTDLVDMWTALERAWVETTSFLGDAWSVFLGSFRKGWASAQGFVAKGILELMGKFDDSFDVEGAKADIDNQTAGRREGIDAETNAALTQREASRKERLAEIEASRDAKKQAIEDFLNDSKRNAALDEQLEAGDAKLAKLMAELDALKAQAADAAADAAKGDQGGIGGAVRGISQAANTGLSLRSGAGQAEFAKLLRGAGANQQSVEDKQLGVLKKIEKHVGEKPNVVESPI